MAIAHDNMLQYKMVESGTTHGGLDFQRYIAIGNDTKPVSVQEWTRLLVSDETNADGFVQVLKNAPYMAYFLETKGVSSKNVAKKDFQFVLVNVPRLASFAESSPDPHSFQQHFEQCRDNQDDACAFSNLGGDAMLIAPMQRQQDTSLPLFTYSHLASFVRRAPSDQVQSFWRKVAQTYQQEWSNDSSIWLSTEGSGVAWLHLRLDSLHSTITTGRLHKKETIGKRHYAQRNQKFPLPYLEQTSKECKHPRQTVAWLNKLGTERAPP